MDHAGRPGVDAGSPGRGPVPPGRHRLRGDVRTVDHRCDRRRCGVLRLLELGPADGRRALRARPGSTEDRDADGDDVATPGQRQRHPIDGTVPRPDGECLRVFPEHPAGRDAHPRRVGVVPTPQPFAVALPHAALVRRAARRRGDRVGYVDQPRHLGSARRRARRQAPVGVRDDADRPADRRGGDDPPAGPRSPPGARATDPARVGRSPGAGVLDDDAGGPRRSTRRPDRGRCRPTRPAGRVPRPDRAG